MFPFFVPQNENPITDNKERDKKRANTKFIGVKFVKKDVALDKFSGRQCEDVFVRF